MINNTKKKAKKTSPRKRRKQGLSPLEKTALDKCQKRDRARAGPVKFKKIGDRQVTHIEQEWDKFFPQMTETTGSTDIHFFKTLFCQVTSTLPKEESDNASNFIAAFMHGLKPRDEMEGILIAQMVGTHNLLMEYMKRAVIPEQYLEAAEDYTNRAYKLLNVFLRQMEALQKYRGKTSQQKVIVEHVHIHEGGQAVVGHIESRPRGEGDGTKN